MAGVYVFVGDFTLHGGRLRFRWRLHSSFPREVVGVVNGWSIFFLRSFGFLDNCPMPCQPANRVPRRGAKPARLRRSLSLPVRSDSGHGMAIKGNPLARHPFRLSLVRLWAGTYSCREKISKARWSAPTNMPWRLLVTWPESGGKPCVMQRPQRIPLQTEPPTSADAYLRGPNPGVTST